MSKPKKKGSTAKLEAKALRILARARREPRFRLARERVALIDAILYGDSNTAPFLLARGVDPNSTDSQGKSALWHAAYWGRREVLRDLVAKGARLPDDVLMGPVHEGDVDTVRFLIRHGANVNCIAAYTRFSNKFPVKEVLLTAAIRNVRSHRAAEAARREFRAAQSAKWRAAHPARPRKDVESIPILLIKAGASVNRLESPNPASGKFARTILGLAAECGLIRTVKAILAARANVNQRDTWGGTALLEAAQAGRREVVRALLAARARKDLKRRDGATAISIARENGFADLADEIENYRDDG